MTTSVWHLLLLEDDPRDADLVLAQFESEGVPVLCRRVVDRGSYEAALAAPRLDVIISDYTLPGYDGLAALAEARRRRPEVPFIFCSGGMGEERAVETLRQGAVDFVLKDRIARIVPAVRRALAECEERNRRLLAEAALRESEERYRRLFEESSDAMLLHEIGTPQASGQILEVNAAGLRLLGHPPEELRSLRVHDLEEPGQPATAALDFAALQRGEDVAREVAIVTRRGHRRTVDWRSRLMSWHGHSVVLSVMRDISEHLAATAAMRLLSNELARVTGERFFAEMLARVAALLAGEAGFVSRRRTGTEGPDEVVALWCEGTLPDPASFPLAELCAGTGHEGACVLADGLPESLARHEFVRSRQLRAAVSLPLHDSSDRRIGQIGMMWRQPLEKPDQALDLLQLFGSRTAAELERQRGERQFASLFEFAPDALLMLDAGGRIVLVNRQAEALFGWSRAEMLGQDIGFVADSADEGRHTAALRQRVLSPGPSEGDTRGSLSMRRKDGSIFSADVRSSPIEAETGPLVATAFRDMTPFKEAERRMLRAQRLESLGTLAGGIAHDLNNVLTPILGGAELVQPRVGPAERAMVENIAASARRGANMVRQLLTFARGAEAGHRSPVEPAALLRELERILQNTLPKNIHVLVECAPDAAAIEADPTQIHQVLLNLCVNARDAMPDGGNLHITAGNAVIDETFAASQPEARPGNHLVISVADNGAGISPEVIDRIFEPFFTTKDASVGTGLGLSTALGIVKSHGGFLQVRSESRRGSTFTVYLPASDKPAPALPAPAQNEFRGHGETILITDDEPLVRQTMRSALERLGFNVVEATDGTGALVTAAQLGERVHAVVSDVNMPHMDGVTLVRAVRRILPKVCIIAVSGRHERTKTAIFRSLGVKTFLDKPYTLQQLLEALRDGLSS